MTTYRDLNRDLLGHYAPRWRPTHRLTCPHSGQSWEVMISDAGMGEEERRPAYREEEWLTESSADIEVEMCCGRWYFLGQLFTGRVESIPRRIP